MAINDLGKQSDALNTYNSLKQAASYAAQWTAAVQSHTAALNANDAWAANAAPEELAYVASMSQTSDGFVKAIVLDPQTVVLQAEVAKAVQAQVDAQAAAAAAQAAIVTAQVAQEAPVQQQLQS